MQNKKQLKGKEKTKQSKPKKQGDTQHDAKLRKAKQSHAKQCKQHTITQTI